MGGVEVGYYPKPLSLRSVLAAFAAHGSRYIRGLTLAHVRVLVTGLMYCYKVLCFPIIVVSIYMM